jgi:AmmeMemoRadiSam system protein A/AmmeMemoRadiSam system protein B
VAAKGYVLIDPAKFSRVAILAPAHRFGFRGISTGSYTAFASPLGEVAVDMATCARLAAADPLFTADSRPHENEHAIEVHLPFLQTVFAKHDVAIIPLLCGQLEENELQHLAEILRKVLPADTLVVASSDFTHFGPDFGYTPFTENIPEQLQVLDMKGADQVCRKRIGGFRKYLDRTGATICGAVPIVILLEWLGPADETIAGRVVDYSNSGALTHDYRNCVSYATIAFETLAVPMPKAVPANTAELLGPTEKRYLLQLARRTIGNVLLHRSTEIGIGEVPEKLRVPGTCFVSLHYHGNLRGCIGTIGGAPGPLYRNVIANTVAAAFRDPRFSPLRQEEFIEVEVEISVMTPPRPIAGWQEIELGKHGIILAKNQQQAVFLPQVAPEQGWNLETTLTHLATKAGLPGDAWKEGAKFQVFEAIVFNERDLRK